MRFDVRSAVASRRHNANINTNTDLRGIDAAYSVRRSTPPPGVPVRRSPSTRRSILRSPDPDVGDFLTRDPSAGLVLSHSGERVVRRYDRGLGNLQHDGRCSPDALPPSERAAHQPAGIPGERLAARRRILPAPAVPAGGMRSDGKTVLCSPTRSRNHHEVRSAGRAVHCAAEPADR